MNKEGSPRQPASIESGTENNQQGDNTLSSNQCQCPNCGFSGQPDLFMVGWLELLQELTAKYPEKGITLSLIDSMTIPDQYGTYLHLLRYGVSRRSL